MGEDEQRRRGAPGRGADASSRSGSTSSTQNASRGPTARRARVARVARPSRPARRGSPRGRVRGEDRDGERDDRHDPARRARPRGSRPDVGQVHVAPTGRERGQAGDADLRDRHERRRHQATIGPVPTPRPATARNASAPQQVRRHEPDRLVVEVVRGRPERRGADAGRRAAARRAAPPRPPQPLTPDEATLSTKYFWKNTYMDEDRHDRRDRDRHQRRPLRPVQLPEREQPSGSVQWSCALEDERAARRSRSRRPGTRGSRPRRAPAPRAAA